MCSWLCVCLCLLAYYLINSLIVFDVTLRNSSLDVQIQLIDFSNQPETRWLYGDSICLSLLGKKHKNSFKLDNFSYIELNLDVVGRWGLSPTHISKATWSQKILV